MNSQSVDEGGQIEAQVEAQAQASTERKIELSIDTDYVGAPAVTLIFVIVQTDSDLLEWRVSGVLAELWRTVTTYGDNVNDDSNETTEVTERASETVNVIFTIVDDGNELEDNLVGAVIVVAAVELLNDGAALAAEVGPSVLDLAGGPLRDDLWDGTGESHGTSSEDSEDGEETHGEEA